MKAEKYKDTIVERYTKEKLSASAIARELHLAVATVTYNLKKWGIPLVKRYHLWDKHPCWIGGRVKSNSGYWDIRLQPDDFFFPMARQNGYVREHRLVVAKALGRCLLAWETVHHKEGCAKDDNRYPETLELLPHSSRHNALTKMFAYIKKLEKENKELKVRLGIS